MAQKGFLQSVLQVIQGASCAGDLPCADRCSCCILYMAAWDIHVTVEQCGGAVGRGQTFRHSMLPVACQEASSCTFAFRSCLPPSSTWRSIMDSLCCYSKHSFPVSMCWLPDLTHLHRAHDAHDAIVLLIELHWSLQGVNSSLVSLRDSPQEPGGDAEL